VRFKQFLENPANWVTIAFLAVSAMAAVLFASLFSRVAELGFVSDDYLLLVEDANLPWYASSDHLYRVFRNGLCRLLPRFLGMQPQPYHVVGAIAFLACLVLLALFLRQEGAGVIGTTAGLVLVAFCPRNDPQMFGFVWLQESGAAAGILAGLILWRIFRQSGSRSAWLLALASFAVGIGFKETAVVFPALVLAMDLFHARVDWKRVKDRQFWMPYLGVAFVAVAYMALVLSQSGGRLRTPDPRGVYETHDLPAAALALVRDIFNLALLFKPGFGLRDMRAEQYALAALVGGILLLMVWRSGTLDRWLVSGVWVLATFFPPSMFARQNNVHQYFFLPIIGLAFGLSATVSVLSRRQLRLGVGLAAAMLVYATAGTRVLEYERNLWVAGGRTTQEFVRQVVTLSPPTETNSLILVNSPASFENIVPVLASGLRGALFNAGYHRNLRGMYMPEADDKLLLETLNACPSEPTAAPGRILVRMQGKVIDRTGYCAQALINADLKQHPWRWLQIYSATPAP